MARRLPKKTIPHTIPMLMAIDESFDIGSDTRTGVDDSYKLPFHFTGTIDKLTYKLGPNQMTAEEQKAARRRSPKPQKNIHALPIGQDRVRLENKPRRKKRGQQTDETNERHLPEPALGATAGRPTPSSAQAHKSTARPVHPCHRHD